GELAPAVAALSGANNEAAIAAAEQVGKATQPAGDDALLAALAFGMPAPVAVTAINALAKHPAPPDVAALVRYAGHHTPLVRGAALVALAAYPDPVAKKAVAAGLRDLNEGVRAAAAGAAAKGRVRDA